MAAESGGIIIKFMCISGVPHFFKLRGKCRREKRKCFDFSVNKYKIHVNKTVRRISALLLSGGLEND